MEATAGLQISQIEQSPDRSRVGIRARDRFEVDERCSPPHGQDRHPLVHRLLSGRRVRTLETQPQVRRQRILVCTRAKLLRPGLPVAIRRLHADQLDVVVHLTGVASNRQRVSDVEERAERLLHRRTGRCDLLRAGEISGVLRSELALSKRDEGRRSRRADRRGVGDRRGRSKRVVFLKCSHEAVEAAGAYVRVGGGQPFGRRRSGAAGAWRHGGLRRAG